VLTDGVITLGPLRLEDAAAHLAGEDAELVRWLNGGPGTPAGVEAYIRRAIAQWAAGGPKLTFGIRTADGLAGTIDVDLGLPGLQHGEANLAYGLYPAFRGRGLATRAVLLACRYLRDRGDIDRAVIRTHPANLASAAVAERAGFVPAPARRGGDGAVLQVRVLQLDRG
jgi:RimJ/RimL family protein N-acetyltransferase